ncbi:hypothetical protein BT96DRAFT_995280 [Gymnopus androsaceus JB14]|uniref:Alcohol dehydrogenase-like C-terminal domain-containing protein n=1 Tax=Gymnopus androsaceus JB14 TaxID=1447944 RepID=A0A6A4HMB1_9AGAR|nr:hypothetical protein BT96DRAFT_995280 [Gymnopus androsaceus JB14]
MLLATKLGAQYVINYKKTLEWQEKLLQITGGRRVDHILDVVGAVDQTVKAICIGGWIHTIGVLGVRNVRILPHFLASRRRRGNNDLRP